MYRPDPRAPLSPGGCFCSDRASSTGDYYTQNRFAVSNPGSGVMNLYSLLQNVPEIRGRLGLMGKKLDTGLSEDMWLLTYVPAAVDSSLSDDDDEDGDGTSADPSSVGQFLPAVLVAEGPCPICRQISNTP